jgi:hypothetical protein
VVFNLTVRSSFVFLIPFSLAFVVVILLDTLFIWKAKGK